MKNSSVDWHEYFNTNSNGWLKEAYKDADYSYPVGYNRLRILKKILGKYNLKDKKILDIGCGGGDISLYLVSQGAVVDGIDMSESMLQVANERRNLLVESEKKKIKFWKANFTELDDGIKDKKYDFVIAFGLIGYLESDEQFLEGVNNISKPGTILIFSCRNRLFNITSVTSNTIKEIESNNAKKLIEEIEEYYQDELPIEKSREFISKIYESVSILNDTVNTLNVSNQKMAVPSYQPGTSPNQPRQSTPRDICETALEYGFQNIKLYGVHPHLLLPRMNKMLPPRVFNVLSDALCAFEDESISLIYSSVFIGEFSKGVIKDIAE